MKNNKGAYSIGEEELKAYFEGKATRQQVADVRAWMQTAGGQDYVGSMMDEDIAAVNDGREPVEVPAGIPSLNMLREINRALRRRHKVSMWGRVAAVLIPLFVVNALVFTRLVNNERRGVAEINTISVPAGEQLRVILQDGTSVMLNSGSTLQYPGRFARKERTVSVTGEAFFDVARDERRPFVVATDEVDVKVLGTKFNVNTIDEADVTTIYLKEGSVRLTEKVSGNSMSYMMKPGQLAMVQKSTGMCYIDATPDRIDIEGWMHRRYYFKDAPLADLLRHLERTYGVMFNVMDSVLYNYTYTMNFTNESIEDILYQMERITPIRCVISNNNITIYGR